LPVNAMPANFAVEASTILRFSSRVIKQTKVSGFAVSMRRVAGVAPSESE
jgi:hypothetical protein